MYYAHSTDDDSQKNWHFLRQHLTETGHMAAKSAEKFGAQKAVRLAGVLHDLGKYTPAFQARLVRRPSRRGVDRNLVQVATPIPSHVAPLAGVLIGI